MSISLFRSPALDFARFKGVRISFTQPPVLSSLCCPQVARIGLFLHTPFPPSEVFRALPHREDLLRGMLGADQVGEGAGT